GHGVRLRRGGDDVQELPVIGGCRGGKGQRGCAALGNHHNPRGHRNGTVGGHHRRLLDEVAASRDCQIASASPALHLGYVSCVCHVCPLRRFGKVKSKCRECFV